MFPIYLNLNGQEFSQKNTVNMYATMMYYYYNVINVSRPNKRQIRCLAKCTAKKSLFE